MSRSSANEMETMKGLRSQHHHRQHKKRGDSLNKSKDAARRDQSCAIIELKQHVSLPESGHNHIPGLSWALQARKQCSFKLMPDWIRVHVRPNLISALPGTDSPLGTTNSLLPASSPHLWTLRDLWHRQWPIWIKCPL